jgi:hypothetical protein
MVMTDGDNNAAVGNSSGAPAGYTGSPGDGRNCTACHAGTATSQNGLITSNIPVFGYSPDSIYAITASIATAGVVKFGFEVSPQNVSGTKLGTLTATNSTQTQLVNSGKYITHKLAGTSTTTTGSKSWTFNWTAPIAGTGDVTFYGAFNSSNDDGSDDGDKITLSQFLVHENTTTGVHEPVAESAVKVFPNPASSFINVAPASAMHIYTVSIFDLQGKKIMEEDDRAGETFSFDIQALNAGIYILVMNMPQKVVSEKIMVSHQK